MTRALLFLDVDGPLIPFGASARELPGGYPNYGHGREVAANPLLARVNPAHGRALAVLPCQLVWATTWTDDANACVAPLLGLPELPVVHWSETAEENALGEPVGLHWKTCALVAWAAGRPFVWADDEISTVDRTWVSTHHPAPALLHRVDARRGLTDADFTAVDQWLRSR